MPQYLFGCAPCGGVLTLTFPASAVGEASPLCGCGRVLVRHYTPPTIINYRSGTELAERALRGEETVPGLTREETMATAAQMAKDRK